MLLIQLFLSIVQEILWSRIPELREENVKEHQS
jgi:hypothetical protein